MPRFVRIATLATSLLILGILTGCGSEKKRAGQISAKPSSGRQSEDSSTVPASKEEATPAATSDPVPASETAASEEGGWGTLVMRFAYGGTPPTPTAIDPRQDPAFCSTFDLHEEKLVVNPENNGLANVFVYLVAPAEDLDIHPSYAATAEEPAEIDNSGCSFVPHALVMRTTQPLVIGNTDTVGHNSNGNPRTNRGFNVTVGPGSQVTINPPLTSPERKPFPITCNMHSWMKGHILVQDHPYAAVSDPNGELRIENLPAGTWEFQVWQEEAGNVSNVSIDGEETSWDRGKFTVAIEPDTETNLGEIIVPANSF